MLDDIALVLASIGAATGAVALLRRRYRKARTQQRSSLDRVGTRRLAEVLCAAAAEPLRLAGPQWKSLAEMVQVEATHRLD